MMDYKELCVKVIETAKKAGAFMKKEQEGFSESKVEEKSINSLVSYVDKTAEKMIVDDLLKYLPEAGFIAEEGTSTKIGETYNWIIDPLDGTTNYIHGLPTYAVSIALKKNDKIVLGVVLEVGMNECFYAYGNNKAYLNKKEIHVKTTSELKDTLIATGFPYYDFSRNEAFYNTLITYTQKTRGMRRLGTAATDLVYVACGRFDAFYEYGLSPWDVAAGAFIVEQAGGKVSDYKGENDWLFGKEIIATSSNIYNDFAQIVFDEFNKNDTNLD
ncbi:MAG: inositol monophosphatase [Ichthyobacteriaceae bacterium]|nr:inositol monophosphatase [Ichthyobacteriaceae bacterium]